ncbi:MAG: NADH-quinone oxidoreductase, subunit [Cyanobacteria bacterium RYN_339]|nr:NADH-quinone oxidoreductase, subunit [Cyanobacteria bacterium RYN_339]
MIADFPKILTKNWHQPDSHTIDRALQNGAYKVAHDTMRAGRNPQEITDEVKKSGLRGRGGAGFPTGMKWGFLPKDNPKPRYLVINADESEPGTYKDRAILENDPHMLIEGCILASYAINAHDCYIYVRGEFWHQQHILNNAVKDAYAKGYLGNDCFGSGFKLNITVHSGAGAYICGEETALLTSLEGERGYPRLKPPFPATHGLFQCPTVVNNVETIANVPWIIEHGGAEYAKIGKYVTNAEGKPVIDSRGTRLMCISGIVNQTGVHEIPLGITVMDYINDYCGGLKEGATMKALIPGGSSCPILTAEEAMQAEMTYESMAKLGTMFGSGGMIVIGEETSLVWALHNLLRFYSHESCGQCTPCREGTDWLYKILTRMLAGKGSPDDLQEILDIADNMENKTICALAAAATMPTRTYIKKFKDEFVACFTKGGIPVDNRGRYLQPAAL